MISDWGDARKHPRDHCQSSKMFKRYQINRHSMTSTIKDGDYPREDALQKIMAAALQNQDIADQTLEQVRKAAENLKEAAEIIGSAAKSLPKEVSMSVVEDLHSRLGNVQQASELARRSFEQAARTSAIKFYLSGFLGMVTAICITAWFILPSAATLRALNDEKSRLEEYVADLKRRFPKMEFGKCDGRACVRTIEKKSEGPYGEKGETFRIIYGQ
jgi:hypothetical protein